MTMNNESSHAWAQVRLPLHADITSRYCGYSDAAVMTLSFLLLLVSGVLKPPLAHRY